MIETERFLRLQAYTFELRKLYAAYHDAYRKVLEGVPFGGTIHTDRNRLAAMDKVAALEQKIREELGIHAYIDVVPATWPAFNQERAQVKSLVTQTHSEAIAAMQRMKNFDMSLAERVASPAARELANARIAFGLLYSNANGAAIVTGETGFVHQDIRDELWGTDGQRSHTRPAVSGIVVPANGRDFFISDSDNPALIWPSNYLQIEQHSLTVPVVGIHDTTHLKEVREGVEGRLQAPILASADLKRAVLLSNNSYQALTLKEMDMQTRIATNAKIQTWG